MESNRRFLPHGYLLGWALFILVVVGAAWIIHASWPKGEALESALQTVIEGKNAELGLVAKAILQNYRETRQNASLWSGAYWGFTFAAATLSALAALVLKLESPLFIRTDAAKKDLAAVFSVVAALLVTLSTSGDFQRKWQANRVAAAELERTGYALLEKGDSNPRTYLARVGDILELRHMAIVGNTEKPPAKSETIATSSDTHPGTSAVRPSGH